MKAVKDINRLIFGKVLEILFVIGFIYFAMVIFQDADKRSLLAFAAEQENYAFSTIEVENMFNYSITPLNDVDAVANLRPCHVKVINETLTEELYTAYLIISKESALDYHYLRVAINDQIYALEELLAKADEENYYFLIDTNTIKGEVKDYMLVMWLDENTDNDMQNKDILLSFDLVSEVTKM